MARVSSFLVTVLLATGFGWPLTPATAGTLFVPGDYPSIQAGIQAAGVGDTVLVACGTYLEHDLIMKAGITLAGESSDPSCVVIDAQNQSRVLDCADLSPIARIENMTFTNGNTTDGWFTALGGGIRCLTSSVAISNCVFRGNTARIGAGLGASESYLELNDCVFESNAATHGIWAAGGAFWARDCSGSIDNCRVAGNTAFSDDLTTPGDGGGFFFNNSHLEVSDSHFMGNSTGAGAGAFYSVTNDSSVFTGCVFETNTAGNGGAVYFEFGAAAQLINCSFINNSATAGGAIVSFNGSFPSIFDCLFENNQATQYGGGAIEAWASELTVSGCNFNANSAASGGGAIHLGDCSANISSSIFHANSALEVGGAIRCHFATVSVSGSTLVENSAPSGGGIFVGTGSFANIDRCIIAFSLMGESVAGLHNEIASVSCSDFYGNQGGDWSGSLAAQLGVNGNFSADPRFCNDGTGEFYLDSSSPCAPENNIGCGLIGATVTGCAVSEIPDGPVTRKRISGAQNYPNPFNPVTTIRFDLTEAGPTRVAIFDLGGHLIRTLVEQQLPAQTHEVMWGGRDESGQVVAAGIYFFRINSGESVVTGRMALVK